MITIWEHLLLWSTWLNDKSHPGRSDVIGASMTCGLIAACAIGYFRRTQLASRLAWIAAHPVATTLISTPIAVLILICLSKFAPFIAAGLTAVGLLIAFDNNRKSHEREQRRFRRQGAAARAALPLELSAASEYCRDFATALKSITPEMAKRRAPAAEIEFPLPPSGLVGTLGEVILSTDDEALAKRAALVLSYVQFVKGFASVLKDPTLDGAQNNIHHVMIRLAILEGLVGSLFDYAREATDDIKPFKWRMVSNAVSTLNLDHDHGFRTYYRSVRELYANPLEMLAKPALG